jgi:DNA-binding NtrC family response regulator
MSAPSCSWAGEASLLSLDVVHDGLPDSSYAPDAMSRLSLLVDLATLLSREVDLDALLGMACERVAEAMDAERATVWLIDAEQGDLLTRVAVLPELASLRQPIHRGLAGHVARTGEVLRVDNASADERFDPSADRATGYTTRSMLVAPIREDERSAIRGVIQLLNKRGSAFDQDDERYLAALGIQLGRALAWTTLRAADESGPGVVLRGPYNHVIGRSPVMQSVFQRIGLAAKTDATVLLRGETGTGKGLLARAIHVNSPRQTGPFVTLDCTTLPGQLVESELFGHERGAFTGADRRVLGKVELAHGGVLLLDEIGDLPLEIQGKLMRFLQDRRFERVGGRQELSADVRILCATHRDLEKGIAQGTFREDLYYRIRVVELEIPALRDRGADEIQTLARHFAQVYAARYRRPPPRFETEAMAVILSHSWPGNVRELEHWIESAVVLAPDGRIGPPHLPSLRRGVTRCTPGPDDVVLPLGLTLVEATQRYVQATVEASGGNKTQAAHRLQVGRNTIARAMDRAARTGRR